MAACSGIKPDGSRCKGIPATGSDYCPAHDPARAEARKRASSKAARSRGGAELGEIKRDLRRVINDVLSGRIDKGRAAVALQGYNALIRVVEVGRKDGLEDLAREVEELKRGYGGAA